MTSKLFALPLVALSTLTLSTMGYADTHEPIHFQKIMVVMFENMSYAEIKNEPTFKKLVEYSGNTLTENGRLVKLLKPGPSIDSTGNGFAFFSSYYNNHSGGTFPTRPSQPNYLAMTSGSIHAIQDNEIHNLNVDNLAMELNDANISWKVYADDLPDPSFNPAAYEKIHHKKLPDILPYVNDVHKNEQENDIASHEYYLAAYKKAGVVFSTSDSSCFTEESHVDGPGGPSDGYMRKHEPFISYLNVQNNFTNCKNIVNSSHLKDEIDNLPAVSFYIPNQIHDGHNGSFEDRIVNANAFLSTMLGTDPKTGEPLPDAAKAPLQKFMAQNGLLVITFDEPSVTGNPDLTVYTLLAGKMITSGAYPNPAGQNKPICYPSLDKQAKDEKGFYNPIQCNHYNLLKLIETNWQLRGLKAANTSAGYKNAFSLDNGISTLWR